MSDTVDACSLRTGFFRNAAEQPGSVAIAFPDRELSYGELGNIARVWAAAITDRVSGPAERVGVLARRGLVAYTGNLASLAAGAAFVPLNPAFPPERLRTMVRRADLDAIITDAPGCGLISELLAGIENTPWIIVPESEADLRSLSTRAVVDSATLAKISPLRSLPAVMADDLAYLLFTSGTTGEPKGVGVTHANVLHFLDVMTRRYCPTRDDRFSQTFELTFDLSVFDQFMAWGAGARLCTMKPLEMLAPADYVRRNGITSWFSVPSAVSLLRKLKLLKPRIFPTIRWSLFCGEAFPQVAAEAWHEAAPNSTVENLYGPTELTIACLVHRWDPLRSPRNSIQDLVPIGRPLEGLCAQLLPLDEEASSAAEEEGELCIAGPQTVPGYWRDPSNTLERFVELPVSRTVTKTFYRTGDKVRRLPDGEYAYLGRIDSQVKIMGHRIELGEIEAVIRRCRGVSDAVAIPWPYEDGHPRGIVAIVVGTQDARALIKDHARRTLPDYMVPREVYLIDSMPLNPNGKIDRGALFRRLEDRVLGI